MARHLAIGDIHGCLTALKSLVEFVEFRDDDTIITLGDYVDRGPDSRGVVDFVIELGKRYNLVPLRGNHEIMMLDSRDKKSWLDSWLQYGGEATLMSYSAPANTSLTFDDVPDAHIDFLTNDLKAYYECESHFFVHANADPRLPLPEQSDAALYWKKYDNPRPHCSGKVMVCGHTAQLTGFPSSNEHSICIDTWAYGRGWLTCFDVDAGMVWQANEAGATRKFEANRYLTARKTHPRN